MRTGRHRILTELKTQKDCSNITQASVTTRGTTKKETLFKEITGCMETYSPQ
jgi:hypothetical protein